jgi:hypothetical protein
MVLIRTPLNQTIFVKPHVQALANALHEKFGLTSFGTYLGHSPPEGPTQALDIFTPDNSSGWAIQDRVCQWLQDNAKRFGVRYCIKRLLLWNIERSTEGWRIRTATGNRTTDHMDHVHDTQYTFAPGPFGVEPTIPAPPQTIPAQGGDMLIFNVKNTGIFLQRGDQIQHLLHPDHVLAFVKIGVPYQDKVELSREVAETYLGISVPSEIEAGFVIGLDEFPPATSTTEEYEYLLTKVRAGIEEMKQEYYDMMLADG